MSNKNVLGKVILCIAVVCIMVSGAWGIYMLKHEYPIERIEEMLSSNIADVADDVVLAVKDKIPTTAAVATVDQTATRYVMSANAGGEIDNSSLTDQEKGYDEYIKNLETHMDEKETSNVIVTSLAKVVTTEKMTTTTVEVLETTTGQPETTPAKAVETMPAKERETTPAPTTTAKKKGVVVTDERWRAAMIQLGYDPDNYVASDLTTAEKIAISRLVRGEATSVPKEHIIYETVDYSQRTLEYDGPELPKPMG